MACRVTSKILGIGAAERNWGDVKRLKCKQRSHLQGDKVKKQATLYGGACLERARRFREEQKEDSSSYYSWNSDDIGQNLGLEEWGVDIPVNSLFPLPSNEGRFFNAWKEDWEVPLIMKKDDPVAEAKLAKKYGGLKFIDVDRQLEYVTDEDELEYSNRNGWCAVGRCTDPKAPTKIQTEYYLCGHESILDSMLESHHDDNYHMEISVRREPQS